MICFLKHLWFRVRGRWTPTSLIAITLSLLCPCASAFAQQIPRDEYTRFFPLSYPRIISQTSASEQFAIFGDRSDPNYRDVHPADGMDDRRHDRLLEIAVRFAPYMVKNTTAIPMDFEKFMEGRKAFLLFVDTWDLAKAEGELVKMETIDFVALGRTPCEPMLSAIANDSSTAEDRELMDPDTVRLSDDCRLLALLQEFHPQRPQNERFQNAVSKPEENPFKVMFFDFPGEDEQSWKREYENAISGDLPRAYKHFSRIYAHPFIHQVRSNIRGGLGYEFVLQYWFFYPFNDGGNNHEGDWEHINVVVTLKDRERGVLSAPDIRRILGSKGSEPLGLEVLVISRVEYYFHHK